jgi:cytochrome P450
MATTDVDLSGVTIPAGSVINVRFGAANHDERRFAGPAEVQLDRKAPRTHVGFGAGVHYCMGAPLARREVHLGFKALLERVEAFSFVEGQDFRHHPNLILRGLENLHLKVSPRSSR